VWRRNPVLDGPPLLLLLLPCALERFALRERAGFADTGAIRAMTRMPPDRRDGYKVYVWRAPGGELD